MTPKKSKVSKPSGVSFLTFLLFSPLLSFFFSCCFCSSIAGTTIIIIIIIISIMIIVFIIINTHHRHHQPSIINHHPHLLVYSSFSSGSWPSPQHNHHHTITHLTSAITHQFLPKSPANQCLPPYNKTIPAMLFLFEPPMFFLSKCILVVETCFHVFCSCQSKVLPLILSENHIFYFSLNTSILSLQKKPCVPSSSPFKRHPKVHLKEGLGFSPLETPPTPQVSSLLYHTYAGFQLIKSEARLMERWRQKHHRKDDPRPLWGLLKLSGDKHIPRPFFGWEMSSMIGGEHLY